MPETKTFKCSNCHAVTDSFGQMEGVEHSCGGTWHYFDIDFYAQQRAHLTALGGALAFSLFINVVLSAAILFIIGGR